MSTSDGIRCSTLETQPPSRPPAGFTPLEAQLLSDPDFRAWGPLTSSTVKSNRLKLKGEADALSLSLPVDVGGAVEYSTKTNFGAVLMCDDKVESRGFELRRPFLAWLKQNSKVLLGKWPDVGEHGVIAATWTYSAVKVYIHAWEDAGKTVAVGFKVGATGVGGAEPEVSWHRARANEGWSRWDDRKRVVFFTGVKVKYNVFGTWGQDERKWRGDNEDEFLVPEIGGDRYAEAEVEYFGDDSGDIDDARTERLEDEDEIDEG